MSTIIQSFLGFGFGRFLLIRWLVSIFSLNLYKHIEQIKCLDVEKEERDLEREERRDIAR